jgi:hypothetical protein
MTLPRYHPPPTPDRPSPTYHITTKAVDDQFLFTPSAELNYRVARVLELAQRKYPDYSLLDFTLMGNHPHHVMRTTTTRPAEVLRYIHAPIARWVNKLHRRRGPVFGQRYDDKALLDSPATLNALLYSAANPVRAHLTERAEQWMGLSTWRAIAAGEEELRVSWFDEARWRRRGAKEGQRERFMRTAVVKLGVPFEWEQLDADALERERASLRARMREIEADCARERAAANASPAQPETTLSQDPRGRPALASLRRPRERAAGAPPLVERHREEYQVVLPVYWRQSAIFRSGEFVAFPDGTYPPWTRAARCQVPFRR